MMKVLSTLGYLFAFWTVTPPWKASLSPLSLRERARVREIHIPTLNANLGPSPWRLSWERPWQKVATTNDENPAQRVEGMLPT